jgi:hypothetical protein
MDPTRRISDIRDRQPLRQDADVAILAEGFRLAGMMPFASQRFS